MPLTTINVDEKKIVLLSGKLYGIEAIKLLKTLQSYKEAECEDIVLDLCNVEFVDSTFMEGLIYSQILLKKHNKTLILCAPYSHVSQLLREISFDNLFEIIDSY